MDFLKSFLLAGIIAFIPMSLYAEDVITKESPSNESNTSVKESSALPESTTTKKIDDVFKNSCNKTWMERVNETSDKVAFQNFGEKYCDCAASQPLNSEPEIEKAAQVCMSRIFLHTTMDLIEEENGLGNLSSDKVLSTCQYQWKLVYPGKTSANFCNCASSKLADLAKDKDKFTDKEWYDKIDSIAGICSGTSTSKT